MLSTRPFEFNQRQGRFHSEKKSTLSRSDTFIKKVKHLIQINLDNELFDATYLAGQVCLSVSQLNRKLNTLIRQPAGQLIWEMKMDYAAELLSQKTTPIGNIAYQVGYRNQTHFCRSFKRRYACTPSEFKKKHSS